MRETSDTVKLLALTEAADHWQRNKYYNQSRRNNAIRSLADYDLFSVGQLAQVFGVSTTTIYNLGVEKRGYGAGKFNPHSLDTLLQILKNRLSGAPLSPMLLKMAIDEGNSLRVIYKFTGIHPSTIKRNASA